MELVGTLSEPRWFGVAGTDGAGGFYYLGGYDHTPSNVVSKFTAANPMAVDVSLMSLGQATASGVSDMEGTVFTVSGTVNRITMYSNSNTVSIVGELPEPILDGSSV